MGSELSLPVVVKRFEAVVCASERMARRYARHHRGFIEYVVSIQGQMFPDAPHPDVRAALA
jgi:hypothetical protein